MQTEKDDALTGQIESTLERHQLKLSQTDWWKGVIANADRMAVDEAYRKEIAKNLS